MCNFFLIYVFIIAFSNLIYASFVLSVFQVSVLLKALEVRNDTLYGYILFQSFIELIHFQSVCAFVIQFYSSKPNFSVKLTKYVIKYTIHHYAMRFSFRTLFLIVDSKIKYSITDSIIVNKCKWCYSIEFVALY